MVIHCSGAKVGDMDYWRNLRRVLFSASSASVIGHYLSNLPCGVWPRQLPKGEAYLAMALESASPEELFLKQYDWAEGEMGATDLYEPYKTWCDLNSVISAKSSRAFSIRLGSLVVEGKLGRRVLQGRVLYSKL